ncbi:MAG: glycerol-3-phosphate dehydrogenase [Sulfurifustaceae bacterium]
MAAVPEYDVLVVGGGINGIGIARDAAGRGLSVLLCEQDDLAAHTSSASTKLIHGGLRYLEHYEFNLVRKALQEREVLLRAAPHIIRPLRFVMPHNAALRPAWLIRLGLLFYDHLGKRELLAGSTGIDLAASPLGQPLRSGIKRGFVYSDAWVDDARLVVLNAIDASERGATVLPGTRFVSATRGADRWEAALQPSDVGASRRVRARTLVNAAGPWVVHLLRDALGIPPKRSLLMAKGSHIVVRRLFEHDHAYILQNPDKRIIFAIPYEHDYTLIGTTDVAFDADPARPAISAQETDYLCAMANHYFKRQIGPGDVVWSYSGVRPLLEEEAADLSAVTRDYALEYDAGPDRAPLLSVFGGKITTYRRLAEEALDLLAPALGGVRPVWTARAHLPGGDIANADFEAFALRVGRQYPWLPPAQCRRYARAYGTRIERLIGGASSVAGLGENLGDGIFEAEVDYLVKHEWARTADDILWRRSKLGLHVTTKTAQQLANALPAFVTAHQKQEIRHATNA